MSGDSLVGSPVDNGPTHGDASITQSAGPFLAPSLVILIRHMLMHRIDDMHELKARSQLGGKVAGKRQNIVRRLGRYRGTENAPDRSSFAIAEKCMRPQHHHWAADGSQQVLGG
jgi:hypothetical protein